MAKNILNIDNVKGIAKYGVNEYEKVKKKERRKRFEQYEKEDAWLDLSAFEDGFDALDVPKAILGTGVKTAQNFTKGLQSNLEGFLDTGTNLLSMGTEKLGMDKTTNKLRQFAQKDFIADNDLVNKTLISTNPFLSLVNQGVRFKENLEDGYQVGDAIIKNNFAANLLSGQGTLSKGMDKLASNSITGNKLDSLTQTVGQISGQATLGGTGIPWQLTAFANSAGNEMNNAFQNNATAGQAFLSGLISGAVEVGTEYIGGGANKLLGMESLGSKGLAKLGSKISNKLVSRLAKIGIDASSEGLEEVLSGLGTAIGQKLTYMSDKDFNELYSSDQALDDFVMGALGTIITNVPGQVQSIRRGENAFSGLTENEQAVLDKVIEERTNEAQKDGKELTKQQLNEIEDQAREDLQNGYISADMIEETLGEKYNVDKDVVLREAFNERARRRNTFDTDLNQYKDENQRKIVQKAIDSGILNDSKKTHNFVDLVSKIAADKGMDFDFTNNQRIKESGLGVEGKTVNGYVNGNTIGLNIESNNALNKTVGHEITHVLEGSEMYQALQDSLKSYIGQEQWDKRIKELSETYKNVENADVSKELTADLVGENLFNNEDFVRSLSTKDRNLFEKIYDEIKYLVKVATAGSKEKRELVKLQKVFQEAYRDSKTTKENIKTKLDNQDKKFNKENIKYSLNSDAIQNLSDITGESYSMLEANLGDDDYSVKSYLTRHTNLVENYMKENNINVEPVMKSTNLEQHSLQYRDFIKDNDISVLKLANNESLLNRFFEVERQEFGDLPEAAINDIIENQKELFELAKNINEVPNSLKRYDREFKYIIDNTQEIVDNTETEQKIQKEVVESPEFQKYLDDLVQPLFHKEEHTVEEVMEEAKYNHGTTDNYEVGAYMTTDGELLDFGDHGYREDHRTVDAFDLDMNEFMDYGAIRMKPEAPGFEMAVEPTTEQYNKLRDYIEYLKDKEGTIPADNSYINIDVDIPGTNNYNTALYKMATPTSKIINDIKEYWKTGQFPQKSEYADFYYSLSRNEAIAPTNGWEVRGEDIRLQNAIAPLQEQVSQLQDTINGIRDNLAPAEELKPITEEEANRLFDEIPFNPNEEAPLRYNLTPEESKRLDFLDRLERENMLTDNLAEEQRELRAKEENAPEYEKDMTPIESLNDVRDIDEVSSPKVKAYQYEHPEVKPFFQEEARKMLADLNNSTKGERYAIPGQSQNINEWEWIGAERQTSPEIEALLDGELGVKYSYEDIRKGLNAIIEDHGAENIAVAKRIEFLLDDRLRNGYDAWDYGGILKDQYGNPIRIEPNQDYINMLKEQSWDRYYDSIPWEQEAPEDLIAPAEIEEPTIMMTPEEVSRNEVAPVRQDRDIMEMVDNEGVRKSTTKNQPPVIKKQRSAIRNFVDEVQSLFVNRNRQVDNLSRESGNRNLKFLDDMLNGAMGEVNYDINTAQTNNQGEAIGKSIKGLFAEAKSKGLGEAFNDFLLNYSNIDRHRQGKGSQTPEHISKQLVRDYAIKYPEFKQWAKEVWNYGKNARQNLVEAGLIDQELADYLGKIYPHYVPYVSDFDNVDTYFEGVGELKPKAIKRARGGSGKLLSVEDALARYTYAQKNAVRTNNLYKEIVKTLGKVPNFGVDERTDYTNMRDSLFTDSRGNYLTAYENGKQITTQVSSDLYKELSRVNENQIKDFEKKLSLLTTPLQKVSEVRKNLITTWNPTFPITNAIKDIQDALFNSKHTADMIKNYPSALKELATGKGKQVQQFMALYGSGLTMGEYSSDTMSQKTAKVPFLKRIRQANEIIELAPRYAEFKASLQKGESLQEAIYNAREITTNFGRGGTITKALNRNGFTFLNASVQGFDKLIRNFSGENGAKGIVQAMAKVAALGIAPALINHLAFGDDDEEYEALPNYIKDNYYLIKTDDENFIRIPKGRMLSIFGSAARRTLEASQGEETAFEGYLKNAWDQVGINDPGENNIFAPFIQAFGSENGQAWYGGDIVPTRLQDKLPEEQYDETTDKFSIWLGGKLGVSPKKINYVLDQYSGGIGDVLLPMGTEAATSKAETPLDFAIAPIRDKFTADSINDNKYVSNFYSKREELGKIANSSKATEEDQLQKKYLDDISKQMTSLYTEKREIQSDPELSKSEKYERASEIKREINRLAKEGLDNYQNVKTTGDYSNVNGSEYQKTEDGWKKIKDDVSTEINSYGLTDSEKNTYFKTKGNISNIRSKYKDSKDYAAKKTDIINEIRSANLPDEAKIGLYQDAYNDKMAQSYVDAGISADNYLDFKSQTFNADKDKDGKSISGSKKQKVFNYINSMDIPFEQKIILAKTEYPTYNDYNRQVIDYLNNSDIDYEEMVDILKDLGFKVNGDNISW